MAITIQWLKTGAILYTHFSGEITGDDIFAFSEKQAGLVQAYPLTQTFHYINDFSQVTSFPHSIAVLRASMRPFNTYRAGWFIVLTTDFYQEHLCNLLTRIMKIRSYTCPTITDAYHFLQKVNNVPLPDDWPESVDDTMPQRPPSFNNG